MPEPRLETACARPAEVAATTTSPLVPPLELAVVARLESLDHVDALYEGRAEGFLYARDGHPNASQLAAKAAAMEGAEAGWVCASGMAAEAAAILGLVDGGDHVALSEGVYGKTAVLVDRELSRFGVRSSAFDPTRPETLRAALESRTRLVFAESLSNPLLRLADLGGLAEEAHRVGALLVVDNTFAPLICRPIGRGADLVVHSATKLIGGHSDLTLGLVLGSADRVKRASAVASAFGLTGNPFESWLALRGMATLALRSGRACASALELAGRLEGHPSVAAVHYPGLASHADHDRALAELSGGFGTIVSFDLKVRERADALIRKLRHIPFAPSLGDVSTTLSHPATTSHRGLSTEERACRGITAGMIRLSVGLEDVDDLWADLDGALADLPRAD